MDNISTELPPDPIDPVAYKVIADKLEAVGFQAWDGMDHLRIILYILDQEPAEQELIIEDLRTHRGERAIHLSVIRQFGFYSDQWRDGKPVKRKRASEVFKALIQRALEKAEAERNKKGEP